MRDVFNEQLVKKRPNAADTAAKAGLILGVAVILFAAVSVVRDFGIYIGAAAGIGAYFLIKRLNKEYEYIFTNGELDIDVIYSRSSRKRLFSGDVRNFEIMAHVSDAAHARELSQVKETKKYHSGITGESTYAFIATYKGKRMKVIIEPDEKMLEAIETAIPKRKFFKKGN